MGGKRWSADSYVHSCKFRALRHVVHRGRAPSHFWAEVGQLRPSEREGKDGTFFLLLDNSARRKGDEQGICGGDLKDGGHVTCTVYRPRLSSESLSCASQPAGFRRCSRGHVVRCYMGRILVVRHCISVKRR